MNFKLGYWLIIVIVFVIVGLGSRAFINKKYSVEAIEQNSYDRLRVMLQNKIPTKYPSPISRASERITKKPFGIYITPANSPVDPEKFTGYHTGTDFEIFTDETFTEVPFYAICDGVVKQKRTASGYGGLLVQSCEMEDQPVTVVYGHVNLASIGRNVNSGIRAGDRLGSLGQPPTDTDGERKHLHLSIHKGTAVDIKGYVSNQSELSGWINFQELK